MIHREIIAANIKDLRLDKNLSQEKLAELADLDRTYIQSIEQGKRNVSIDVLIRIAKALEVPLVDLIKGID